VAEKDKARALLLDGRAQLAAGNLEVAVQLFEAAHFIMGVPTTGLDLARGLAARGQLIRARSVALAVERMPASPSEPKAFTNAREAAGQLARGLEARIPALVIEVKGPKAGAKVDVAVDGEMVPPGRLGRAWKVDPGEHAVAAAAEQFQLELKTVQVNEGEWARVTIPLRPLPPAPSMTAPTAPESSAWRDTGARIMFAGGALALGAGAFSGAIASQNGWDRTGTTVSVASFIAGGIFIAGGVALVVWPRATNSNVRVSWGAAPTWIGIRCAF
jgi:hypothetical protein